MNWINKFQDGGQAEDQLNILAQALVQLEQLDLAVQSGDKQAAAIMQEVLKRALAMLQQGQAQMAKCGAKLKKKGEQGIKLVKKANCGCKTTLKRIGGKLVNVDCNGNIVK